MHLNQWAKHFVVYGLGIVLMNALPALMIPIYTYRVSPSIYGVLELLNRSQDILILILSFGLRSAVVTLYQMNQDNPEQQKSIYSTSLQFMAASSLAIILALLPLSSGLSKVLFGSREFSGAVVLILAATYFEVLFQTGVLYLQSELRSVLYVSTYAARSILAILLNLVLVFWLRLGLMGILWATLLHTSVFGIAVIVYMCRRTGFQFRSNMIRELLVFGAPLMLGGFGGFILSNGDRYFLQVFRSSSEVGIYGVGYRLGTVAMALVIQPFLKIWSVTMVDISRRPDGRTELGRIATYLLAACIFATLGLSLVGPYLVQWIAQRSYWEGFRIIPVVGLAYVFFAWTIVMDASFYVTKRTIYKLYDMALSTVVVLALYWLLIPPYGMMGAAWATVGGFASFAGFKAYFAQRVFPIHYELGRITCLSLLGLLLYAVGSHVPMYLAISGLAARIALTLAFPALLWAGGFLTREERTSLGESWHLIRSLYLARKPVQTGDCSGNTNSRLLPVEVQGPPPENGSHPRVNGKLWVKMAIMRSGVLSLASRLARRKVVVLYYHSIKDEPGRFAKIFVPGIVHSSSLFRKHMELVAKRYNPVSMDDVARFLRGQAELPSRPVVVTFDDGFADNYEVAAPILNKLGIQALFNVTVGFIESPCPPWFCRLQYAFSTTQRETWKDPIAECLRPLVNPADRRAAFLLASEWCAKSAGEAQARIILKIEQDLDVEPLQAKVCPMMTWDQVRGLRRAGHLIGSHSLTHPNLAYVDQETQWREISESRIQLENKLGAPVDYFSYPNPIMRPNFTERTVESTRRAGYALAVTMMTGPVRLGHDPQTLPRVPAPFESEELVWSADNTLLGRQV